jgi:Uma2 family endonuclease
LRSGYDDGIVVVVDGRVMMSERRERFGVAEYLALEETVHPQELVWGMVRDAPSPAAPHQHTLLDFAFAWRCHAGVHQLGPVFIAPLDCVLDREGGLVVQPDLLFVSKERRHLVTDRVWGAPDLVLEVLSPEPRIGSLSERLGWFARYGVKECWLYHQPQRELDVIVFEAGAEAARSRFAFDERITSSVWPHFERSCADILAPIF